MWVLLMKDFKDK